VCWLPHRVSNAPDGGGKRLFSRRIPPTINKSITFSCLPVSALSFELKGAGLKSGKLFLSDGFVVREAAGQSPVGHSASNFGQFVPSLGAEEAAEPATRVSSPWSVLCQFEGFETGTALALRSPRRSC